MLKAFPMLSEHLQEEYDLVSYHVLYQRNTSFVVPAFFTKCSTRVWNRCSFSSVIMSSKLASFKLQDKPVVIVLQLFSQLCCKMIHFCVFRCSTVLPLMKTLKAGISFWQMLSLLYFVWKSSGISCFQLIIGVVVAGSYPQHIEQAPTDSTTTLFKNLAHHTVC